MRIYEIATNGVLLTQENLDFIKSFHNLPLMKISFDGLGYHDWLRNQKGAEKQAIESIKLCIKNDFKVKVQFNFNNKNLSCVNETLNYLDELGVIETRLIKTTVTPRLEKQNSDIAFTNKEFYDAGLDVIDNYIKNDHKMTVTIWQNSVINPSRKILRFMKTKSEPRFFSENKILCNTIRGSVAIGPSGNIYPCMQMSGFCDSNNIYFGNVKKSNLKQFLQDSNYMKTITKTVKDKCQECKECKYLQYCCCGCPAFALDNGDFLGPDPTSCYFFKHNYIEKYKKVIASHEGWKTIL